MECYYNCSAPMNLDVDRAKFTVEGEDGGGSFAISKVYYDECTTQNDEKPMFDWGADAIFVKKIVGSSSTILRNL